MKNKIYIIIGVGVALLFGFFIKITHEDNMKKTYNDAYFTIATINKSTQETRRSYYEYTFKLQEVEYNRKTVSEENFIKEGDKVLVMFNKNKPSESYLLRNTTIPYKYLDKDTIWTSLPDFINPEDLKFLDE